MPRRSSTRFQLQPQLSLSPPPPQPTNGDTSSAEVDPVLQLRTQWKWAAFSQFFFTFNQLFAMNDVALNDIEDDLVRGSCIVLPRVMQRLLYTLSYDRKVSLDNWQTALRKQYRKRDPTGNPIGPEPREVTPELELEPEPDESRRTDVNMLDPSKDGTGDPPAVGMGDEKKPAELVHANTLEHGVGEGMLHSTTSSVQAFGLDAPSINADGSDREDTQGPLDRPEDENQEESKDWLHLPMLTKLESMHALTEWQFQNPTRLRTLMRSDDEAATWRIEPIGYDSKKNAYWLIGADRLWVQRPIPRPPKSKSATESLKRKRGTQTTKTPMKINLKPSMENKSSKRPRLHAESLPSFSPSKTSGRGSRVAKNAANLKLDEQAKELAALNKLAKVEAGLRTSKRGLSAKGGSAGLSLSTRSSKHGADSSPPKPMGTRMSRRLRGPVKEDDEWQAVPEEWLNGEGPSKIVNDGRKLGKNDVRGKVRVGTEDEDEDTGDDKSEKGHVWRAGKKLKTGLESDGSEISDLTELSELSEEKIQTEGGGDEAVENVSETSKPAVVTEERKHIMPTTQSGDKDIRESPILPIGFTEWETICVTLYEWDHIAERFEKATHYTEKALYKVLVNTIVPVVTEALREIERKHQLSLALTQRKRSSRLLLRQSEKEEAEAAARKRAEEEEKNSRAKRLAARLKKEEEEREKRETSREMRRREREEREQREREAKDKRAKAVDAAGDASPQTRAETGDSRGAGLIKLRLSQPKVNGVNNGRSSGSGSESRTPIGDDWELDCEICHRRGINLDDGTPMMSCGMCSKWQHIVCHDRADAHAGRKRRNWDVVEFFCLQCRTKKAVVNNVDPLGKQNLQPVITPQSSKHNPYMVHTPAGAVPFNPNLHMGVGHTNYGMQNPVNGNGMSYGGEHQVLHPKPTSTSPRHIQPQRQEQSQQSHGQRPFGSTIAFSHYQPQERGLTMVSPSPSSYPTSGHTQPHSQQSHLGGSTNPYMHYGPTALSSRSGTQLYQTTQNIWNVTMPTQAPGYPTTITSYTSNQPIPTHYARSIASPPHVQGGPQWQHQSPPSSDQQNTTQLRHHSTSYQRPPTLP